MVASVCTGLSRVLGHGLKLCPFGCIGGISDQRSQDIFAAVVPQNFYPKSLEVCRHQDQCCVRASGNCIDYRRSDFLELHLILELFSASRACGNAELHIC
jgi:hypothetical protein